MKARIMKYLGAGVGCSALIITAIGLRYFLYAPDQFRMLVNAVSTL